MRSLAVRITIAWRACTLLPQPMSRYVIVAKRIHFGKKSVGKEDIFDVDVVYRPGHAFLAFTVCLSSLPDSHIHPIIHEEGPLSGGASTPRTPVARIQFPKSPCWSACTAFMGHCSWNSQISQTTANRVSKGLNTSF